MASRQNALEGIARQREAETREKSEAAKPAVHRQSIQKFICFIFFIGTEGFPIGKDSIA